MLNAPSHDLGAAGWVALVVIVLGSETLILRSVLTGLRMLLRFLERRRFEAAAARVAAADWMREPLHFQASRPDPSPEPRPLVVHVRQTEGGRVDHVPMAVGQ